MFKFTRSKAGVAAIGVAGLCLGAVSPALADVQPSPNDVTGTGSDTLQYMADFLFDGDTAGDPGYNAGKSNRAFSFDATADANGQAVFTRTGAAYAPTAVLRAGTAPVVRPNGSGAGIASLYTGSYKVNGTPLVDFARGSRLPTCAENTAAATAGYTGLHVYKFATEHLTMGARAAGTNAPAGLTPAQLVNIYNGTYVNWNDIPGNGGGSAAAIQPLVPQTGSGTRSTFLADLKAANGGVDVTLAASVTAVEENDYASLANANQIAPFSNGRLALNNSGYFGAAANGAVVKLTGAAPGGGAVYDNNRALYFVVRESDVTSTKKFQPGGTKNFIETLFKGGASAIASGAFASNIQAAGGNPSYADLGFGQAGTSCTS